MNIDKMLDLLESRMGDMTIINTEVSQVNVGWHIQHSLEVILRVCEAIQSSDPSTYTSTFSFMKKLIFLFGRFPRGKAKAPKSTRPTGDITTESVIDKLELVRNEIPKLSNLHSNAYFHHPVFHNLNKQETKRFIEIHTQHHIKIINDILI